LVEDNAVNQKLARRLLEKLGVHVTLADNGHEAVERLKQKPFDVVLMDCQMPVMDGYEATAQIRAGAAGDGRRRVPIIAMTANALTGDRDRCLLAGMDDYLAKPVVPDQLRVALERTFTRISDVPNSADSEHAVHVGEPSAPIWDVERLLESIGEDPAFVAELIDVFLKSTADSIGLLAAASPTDVVRIAHTVKGAASNIRAINLATRAAELETEAQSRQVSASDLEGLRSAWAEAEHVMRRYALKFADKRTG